MAICPIYKAGMLANPDPEIRTCEGLNNMMCDQSGCAWWDQYAGMCALLVLANNVSTENFLLREKAAREVMVEKK
ncbi:hypothetical protein M0R72_06435 [Candidatus Pacearchaeota archaeon]|jgi:hypothetical protein|nr:hypothetical protein [Candidatus Pacearchaeota archaeon]